MRETRPIRLEREEGERNGACAAFVAAAARIGETDRACPVIPRLRLDRLRHCNRSCPWAAEASIGRPKSERP
jgi:hypothetical protein